MACKVPLNMMPNSSDIYTKQRLAMVEQQLVRRGIHDEKVLAAMRRVPRHVFVDEALRFKAYDDYPLPIGEKQTISQPFMVAAMSEMLELKGGEKVLEIGTGCGYQTAVLSLLVAQVYSIERIAPLLFKARKTLEGIGIHNVALKVADGTLGWNDFAPYDAILVAAGGPEVPKPLLEQLAIGGRIIIPVGGESEQVLKRIMRTPYGYEETASTPCTFVKLVGQYGWRENGNIG